MPKNWRRNRIKASRDSVARCVTIEMPSKVGMLKALSSRENISMLVKTDEGFDGTVNAFGAEKLGK